MVVAVGTIATLCSPEVILLSIQCGASGWHRTQNWLSGRVSLIDGLNKPSAVSGAAFYILLGAFV